MSRVAALFAVFCLLAASPAAAGQSAAADAPGIAAPGAPGELPPGFEGPPAPAFPETISRDESGRAIVRAIRLTSPLRLDGQLDEAVYRELRLASDFVQTEPKEGVPATEKTEIWILFDDENVYVGARWWESQPERMVVNEMRKDSPNVFQNESLSIVRAESG